MVVGKEINWMKECFYKIAIRHSRDMGFSSEIQRGIHSSDSEFFYIIVSVHFPKEGHKS